MKNPKVSVIIPAYNSEDTIEKCIKSVQSQSYNNYEIIVVNDGSEDKTLQKIKKFNCKVINLKKNKGLSNAKNMGIKASNGKYIYILDSDCETGKDCIKIMIKEFLKSKNVGIIGGTCLSPSKNIMALVYDVAERYKDISTFEKKELHYISGSNMCIKRGVIEKIGGFNKNQPMHEDFNFTFRARLNGYKIMFQPKAKSFHHNRNTLKKYLNHAFNAGVYGTIFRLKYKKLVPYGRFYTRNRLMSILLSPLFYIFSLLRIIKKNLGFRPIKEIIIVLPFLCIGQAAWTTGCIKGTFLSIKLNKEIN